MCVCTCVCVCVWVREVYAVSYRDRWSSFDRRLCPSRCWSKGLTACLSHVYRWRTSSIWYVQSMNEMQRSWIELKSTDSACMHGHRLYDQTRTMLPLVRNTSSFVQVLFAHVWPYLPHIDTRCIYMEDDDVASMQVSYDLDIFSSPSCPCWHGDKKKIAKSKSHGQCDLLLQYDICWWWMQMSYRTEAYRISITSSRNSADRNVAVALTCTLLCYWRKSFTIDSSH